MCETQDLYYRCGHHHHSYRFDCGRSALCSPATNIRRPAQHVDGECETCAKIAAEGTQTPEEAESESEKKCCCVVQ